MRSTSAALLALTLALVAVAPAASAVGSSGVQAAGSSPAVQADDPRPPVEQWNRTYDSPGTDIFSSITKTPDGYLLTGWTDRDGSHDGWVLAVDEEGRERWSVVVGDDGTDRLYGAVRTADGGVLVAGRTDEGDQARPWLLKVDDGSVEWERTVTSRLGAFHAVERTDDGVLLGGWTWEDARAGWLVTVDEQGEVERERTYYSGDDARTTVKSIATDGDGALLAGKSVTDDGQDGWAARVAENGSVAWSRTYGTGDYVDVWAAATHDSGYVLAGETGTAEREERDAWIVGLDGNGSAQWERTFGDEGYDWFDSAVPTDEGLLFTGGISTGGIGGADGFVVMIDGDGTERWRTVIGTAQWDKSWPAIATDDGGYLLAGQSSGYATDGTAGWLVRLDYVPEPTATTAPGTTATTAPGTTADESPTDQPAIERDATIESFWRPELTALVALAALALGVLVARR